MDKTCFFILGKMYKKLEILFFMSYFKYIFKKYIRQYFFMEVVLYVI